MARRSDTPRRASVVVEVDELVMLRIVSLAERAGMSTHQWVSSRLVEAYEEEWRG